MHDCTFNGLHEWHTYMVQKLGWMIMAKEHNSNLRLEAYLDTIKNLQTCLKKKINDTKDSDRKDDLEILLDNVKCLECDTNKLINFSTIDHKHKMDKTSSSHKVTNCGLQEWMKCKFENLGWMCLAQRDGNMLRINAYFASIESLIASIEEKIKEVHEKDRKDDLKITLENTNLLKHYAWRILMEKDEKNMSKKSSSHSSHMSRSKSLSKSPSKLTSKSSHKSHSKSTRTSSITSSSTSKKHKKTKKSSSWFL